MGELLTYIDNEWGEGYPHTLLVSVTSRGERVASTLAVATLISDVGTGTMYHHTGDQSAHKVIPESGHRLVFFH